MIHFDAYSNCRRFRNVLAAVLAFLLPASSSIAQTQPAPAVLDFDKLAEEPGTTITHSKRGDEDVTELQRGGVSIQISRQGNKIQTFGVDKSGHGAVLCEWQVYIAMRVGIDACFAGKFPELREDISTSIDAMNKFITTNSLQPTSRKEVEAAALAQDTKLRSSFDRMSPDRLAEACLSRDLAKGVVQAAKSSHAQRQESLSDLLSIQRPPVMSPCL